MARNDREITCKHGTFWRYQGAKLRRTSKQHNETCLMRKLLRFFSPGASNRLPSRNSRRIFKKTLKLGKSHRALCDKTWCELLVVTFKPSDLCHHLTGCPQTAEDWAHCHIGAAIGRTGLQRKLTPHLQPPGVPQRCSYRSSPRLHALETSYQSIDVTLLYLPKTYKKPWKITIMNGKINYKWPFSIAFCMFIRGYLKS